MERLKHIASSGKRGYTRVSRHGKGKLIKKENPAKTKGA